MTFLNFKNYILTSTNESDKDIVKVERSDFENLFDVYLDKNGNYLFNLNSTTYVRVSDKDVYYYTVKHDTCDWPLLSYLIYGSTHLAWLLMKLNKIDAKHVFDIIESGTTVKCLDRDAVTGIVNCINN